MITQQIKRLYCNLTTAERKIATYVIESPQEVTGLTVHQLAEKCGVASSAVIRFCKTIQLQGFSELKLELARELGSKREEQKNTLPAVGHESDFTLCDFAADCRAPTPSAAAELAVPDRNEYRQRVDDAFFRVENAFKRVKDGKTTALLSQRKRLELCSPVARLTNEKRLLSLKNTALDRAIGERCRQSKDGLKTLSGKLTAMNPLAVLSRGYSVAMDESGKVLTTSSGLKAGDRIAISFAEGRAITEVVETETAIKEN